MGKVVVITGGSSGIGQSAAQLFHQHGCTVYELSRSGKSENGIIHITADITDQAAVQEAFRQVFASAGHLDLLINNAGMGISGAVEFTSMEEARRIFDVNFFGCFCCCREALPYLRRTPGAQIINLSSVAAPLSIPFQAFYSASKAAVNSLSLALCNELRPFSIRVSALMPGDASTGFTAAREKSQLGSDLYGKSMGKAVSSMEKDEKAGMSADFVARAVFAVSQKKNPKVLYTVGGKYKLFVLLSKLLPANFCNQLVGMLYC